MFALQGALTLTVNGIAAHIKADDRALRMDVDDPIAFLRASQLFGTSSLGALRLLAEQLERGALTLTIASREQPLIVIGREARGGLVGSLLGVPHLEILSVGLLGRITG